MASFDGGHYFLTALTPVLAEPCASADGGVTSPTGALRDTLATLPNVSHDGEGASPFARSRRVHFARFVVIDQPAFNGRDPGNTIVQALKRTDLLMHGPVDTLTRAWLLLVIDLDPTAGPGHGVDAALAELWDVMGAELASVYRHCHGFERVTDGAGFARYIRACEVDTTMPFNDYWITPPPLPALSMTAVLVAAGAFVLAVAVGVALLAGWWAVPVALAALALAGWVAYRVVMARGLKPFPTAPGSDLPTVLKALFLQEAFAGFAIGQQGAEPAALHAAFGRFLADTRPQDRDAPTQAPGRFRP